MSFERDVYNVYDGLEISLSMLNPHLNEVIMTFALKRAEGNPDIDPYNMKHVFVERVIDHFVKYANSESEEWSWEDVAIDLLACAAMEFSEDRMTK